MQSWRGGKQSVCVLGGWGSENRGVLLGIVCVIMYNILCKISGLQTNKLPPPLPHLP